MTTNAVTIAPGSKDFFDLRDRAAYTYVTGAMPTHLRTYMSELLGKISRFTAPGDKSLEIARQNAKMLNLDDHPMVAKVREFANQGYKIVINRDHKARRPFGKVYMQKNLRGGVISKITVQSDGSVLSSW